MESVNIGVIGCGQMGMDIVRRVVGCNPQLRVVALYDPDKNSLDRAQSELTSSPVLCSSYHKIMEMSNVQWVMRAYYDAYIQDRLTYEKGLEVEAYKILANAKTIGADKSMKEALWIVQKADREFVSLDLKQKIFQYCEDLFKSVGAQTSVLKYNASGAERGAVLDFIDHPLNNRWWLEDEFKKISKLKTEEEKLTRLEFIRTYENPGEGSFYDNISSTDAKHVTSETDDAIDYLWENNGFSRKRLSTQLFQFTPVLEYDELDSNTDYIIRVSGYGETLLRANGERLKPTKYEKGYEQFKEFPLPKDLVKDGKLKITFDTPDEEHLNWRQQSSVTDVWIEIWRAQPYHPESK